MAQQSGSSETASNKGPAASTAGDGKQQAVEVPAKGPAAKGGTEAEPAKRLSLAELFADDGAGQGSENQTDDDDPSQPVDSVDGLMRRHKLTAEQVYAIKVPMAQGAEPLTLGELKDRVGELVDLDLREAEFEQRRVKGEGEMLRAQTEMRELMALIPKEHLSEAIINKVREKHEATMRRERAATLEHIPEWRDEKKRTEEISGIIEMLSDYGFGPEFLGTVVDHRALKFIRDTFLQRTRIAKALAQVRNGGKPVKNQRPSGKAGKGAARPASERAPKVVPDQATRLRNLFGDN